MQYEKEINKVLPELKKYLGKLSWKLTGYIEDDEIFSRAIMTVCEVVSKSQNIQKPEKYIKGIFYRAVLNIQAGVVSEKKMFSQISENIELKDKKPVNNADLIIRDLRGFGENMTQSIFRQLELQRGDVRGTAEALGVHEQTVFYHKRKLKEEYKKLKKVYSA